MQASATAGGTAEAAVDDEAGCAAEFASVCSRMRSRTSSPSAYVLRGSFGFTAAADELLLSLADNSVATAGSWAALAFFRQRLTSRRQAIEAYASANRRATTMAATPNAITRGGRTDTGLRVRECACNAGTSCGAVRTTAGTAGPDVEFGGLTTLASRS